MEGIESKLDAYDKRLEGIESKMDVYDIRLSRIEANQADHGRRLLKIELDLEQKIIPGIQGVAEGHKLLVETFVTHEDMEEFRDAMTEWEVANKASFAEMWNRISKLEKVQ